MDVWFSIEEEPPPRGAKASWRDLKTFVSAPPERVRKAFALLTRTYHGGRLAGSYPEEELWEPTDEALGALAALRRNRPEIHLDRPYFVRYCTYQVRVRSFSKSKLGFGDYPLQMPSFCTIVVHSNSLGINTSKTVPKQTTLPPFRMNTVWGRPHLAQFWCNASPFRINTYEKTGEGGAVIVN